MEIEVNEVINNICDKLGILASELIPEMGRMKIAELGVTIAITAVILIVAIILLIVGAKKLNDDCLSDSGQVMMFLGGFGIAVAIVISIIIVPDFVGWMVSPKAKTFAYVLSKIGG